MDRVSSTVGKLLVVASIVASAGTAALTYWQIENYRRWALVLALSVCVMQICKFAIDWMEGRRLKKQLAKHELASNLFPSSNSN